MHKCRVGIFAMKRPGIEPPPPPVHPPPRPPLIFKTPRGAANNLTECAVVLPISQQPQRSRSGSTPFELSTGTLLKPPSLPSSVPPLIPKCHVSAEAVRSIFVSESTSNLKKIDETSINFCEGQPQPPTTSPPMRNSSDKLLASALPICASVAHSVTPLEPRRLPPPFLPSNKPLPQLELPPPTKDASRIVALQSSKDDQTLNFNVASNQLASMCSGMDRKPAIDLTSCQYYHPGVNRQEAESLLATKMKGNVSKYCQIVCVFSVLFRVSRIFGGSIV